MKLSANTHIDIVKKHAVTLFNRAGAKKIATWMEQTGNNGSETDRIQILEKMASAAKNDQDRLSKAMHKQPSFKTFTDPNLVQRAQKAIEEINGGSLIIADSKQNRKRSIAPENFKQPSAHKRNVCER